MMEVEVVQVKPNHHECIGYVASPSTITTITIITGRRIAAAADYYVGIHTSFTRHQSLL